MAKCVVKSCVSRSEKDDKASGVTFHKVPKDQKRREVWIRNIRLLRKETDWLPSTATVICSKHFSSHDKIPPKQDKGHTKLSNKAVPMVIDETDETVESEEELLEILETPREHIMCKTIKRLKFVSSKRLKCIKNLRQKNKRLKIKIEKLSDIIKALKRKRYLTEEEETNLLLTPCHKDIY